MISLSSTGSSVFDFLAIHLIFSVRQSRLRIMYRAADFTSSLSVPLHHRFFSHPI